MNIALVPNFYLPRLGGVEIAVSNIAHQVKLRGHQVTIIAHEPRQRGVSREVDERGIPVYRMCLAPVVQAGRGRGALHTLRALTATMLNAWRFISLLREVRPQIVNLHYVGDSRLFVLLARRFVPFRLVVNIHGVDIDDHGQRSKWGQWLAHRTLQAADLVLSNSADLLLKARKICPEITGRSAVLGNGVSLEQFAASAAYVHERKYILCVARFVHKKGLDVLIPAFGLIRRRYSGIDLFLVGQGPEYIRCRVLAEQLGLSDAVRFWGQVDHTRIPALLAGCAVFVLASRQEPFGIAVLEAMAARRPVVATRVGGFPEIIQHMRNGILVEPESPGGLAEAILLLLNEPELARTLADEGYYTVEELFTWERITTRYLGYCQQVLQP